MDVLVKKKGKTRQDVVLNLLMYCLLFVFAILSFRYQYLLLNYKEWGDESETIVAAKMMAAGMRLYSEIFNHHGPLTFLPGLLVEKLGNFSVQGHRVAIALLQILAIFSIYKTPVLNSASQRTLVSVVSVVIILVFIPGIYGHMYKYQTMVGIFLVIIFSQYTIPAIFSPEKLNPFRVVLGSVLIVSLPFLAITYVPIVGLLFLASLRSKYFKHIATGCFVGLFANVFFLGTYGSFAGFLAFHLYLNTEILPFYLGIQSGWQLIMNAVRVATSDLAHLLSLIVILLSSITLARKEKAFPWRTLFLVAGLFSLLIRGGDFQGMPYFYAILPLFTLLALYVGNINVDSRASKYVAIGFLLLGALKISLILPGDKEKIKSLPIPTETEFSRLVNGLTEKKDRIIAYSFKNFQYLVSGRLPASGYFFYLPWQEKYNENPKFGILIDACKQIKESMPKVMYIDKWTVWGKYPWSGYAGCIQELIDSNYRQIPDKPYYIRKNLINGFDDYFSDNNYMMLPSQPLSDASPIKLKIDKDATGVPKDKKLVGLGVMFGTYGRVNPGEARLILKRKNGEEFSTDFSLSELSDNRYKYFDVPEGLYAAGEIVSLTGGGISAWESYDENSRGFTCLSFAFSDGSRSFIPGCPMY